MCERISENNASFCTYGEVIVIHWPLCIHCPEYRYCKLVCILGYLWVAETMIEIGLLFTEDLESGRRSLKYSLYPRAYTLSVKRSYRGCVIYKHKCKMLFLRKNSSTSFLSLPCHKVTGRWLRALPSCPNSRLVGRMIPALWGASTAGTDYSRAGGVLGQQLEQQLPGSAISCPQQKQHIPWSVSSTLWFGELFLKFESCFLQPPNDFVSSISPQWMNHFLGEGEIQLSKTKSHYPNQHTQYPQLANSHTKN